jgi:phosphoglycerate dehydrogenase-like enzyme
VPASLDNVLSESRVVFVLAGVTAVNSGMIGAREFALMRPGSVFVLISRAAVVDFPAMLDEARSGRLRIAADVFPEEPVAADDPIRTIGGLLLSPHRAGSLAESYLRMGEMVADDLHLILSGLPPVRLQRAERETVGHLRSKPIS